MRGTKALELPKPYTSAAFKIWLAVVAKFAANHRRERQRSYPESNKNLDRVGAYPPLRKRFAFVAGDDEEATKNGGVSPAVSSSVV
jgi:hypothetical protein